MISVVGEGVADTQMQRFRAARQGGVCDRGLWGWSRHPNYFFEFLGWCAYPVLAITLHGYSIGGLALLGPVMMFWLLRYVSGVPPLEAAMLARRGDAFRDYQARVSAFFPAPPRRRHIAPHIAPNIAPQHRPPHRPPWHLNRIALMNLASIATTTAERMDLPDVLLRAGINTMVARSARGLAPIAGADRDFAAWMATQPIALNTDSANAQHYELPAAFFEAVLGPHRKYSSCLFASGADTLETAELQALAATCRLADVADGQRILELGCGWGALTLHMAKTYPACRYHRRFQLEQPACLYRGPDRGPRPAQRAGFHHGHE